jgi:hypothetical protein
MDEKTKIAIVKRASFLLMPGVACCPLAVVLVGSGCPQADNEVIEYFE